MELRGFEPLTPSMRTRCATGLRYSPENLSQPSKQLAMPARHGCRQPEAAGKPTAHPSGLCVVGAETSAVDQANPGECLHLVVKACVW